MPLWNVTGMSDDRRKQLGSYGRFLIVFAPILAMVCIVGVVALQTTLLDTVHASSASIFPTSHPALVQKSHLNGPANVQQRISLSIGLRPRNQAALTQYVEDISRPGSVNYHRFLTPAQYQAIFSPDRATYDALSQYLQNAGFTITHTYSHRLLISFSGTIAQVERAFSVQISSYTAPGGESFYANTNDPQLPALFVGQIQSFTGLNNATRYQHPPVHNHTATRVQPYNVKCPGHYVQKPSTNPYLTYDQVTTAYNLTDLYNAGFHGEGQSIALFELDSFSQSDLAAYASCYGHSHTPIQTVVVGSYPVPSDGGIVEVELDAELVLSTDPQLGRLVIYEAANDTADYLAEWAQIVQDAVPVVSTSWGLCEKLMDSNEIQQENILFTAAAAQGQSIFAASGDSGSAGCAFDDPGTDPTTIKPGDPLAKLNAGDPAAQPFVTGVGGTTLSISNTSAYNGEQVWNNKPSGGFSGGASGGGISQFWTAPAWQSAPGVKNGYTSGTPCGATESAFCREVPDVSLHADPANGYLIYCTLAAAGCDPTNPWYSVGGTSAAAPMWAAFMALTNEMSLKQNGFNLGFANPLLYQLANNSTKYAASFNDVNTGNNDYNNLNGGSYAATANYDLATGLGSYKAFNLATNLVALANQPRITPASTTWYFAEGSVGNGFQEYITLQNPSTTQDATVNITYLFENKPSVSVSHQVPRSSRGTVSVNQDLHVMASDPLQSVAVIVQVASGGPAIVAERPMYFNYRGIQSGTDVMGATTPQTSYYFPSVDTRQGGRTYLTYITMLNPSTTQDATATVTYYTGTCGLSGQPACLTQTVIIHPLHRGTATPLGIPLYQQTSVSVQSDHPIVVERPMYFSDTIATAGGLTTGAASEVGAVTPGKDWLFAEGFTGHNFQEYLVLANFGTTATTATVTLEYENGHRQAVTVNVPALGHIYFDVDKANTAAYGSCDVTPCQTTGSSSAEVTSAANIVVDRLMYFHYSSANISGGAETVGEVGPASNSVYAFAEGYTAGSFQEYLTLQNPTQSDETVAVTLFVDTYVLQEQVTVKAQSRKTISINSLVVPIAQAYSNPGVDPYAVSMIVQALGSGVKIVAERPMYFNYHGDPGGSDVLGYTVQP